MRLAWNARKTSVLYITRKDLFHLFMGDEYKVGDILIKPVWKELSDEQIKEDYEEKS